MKVYVLTVVYEYGVEIEVETYLFDTLEKAQEKMKNEYEAVINGNLNIDEEDCDFDLNNWLAIANDFDNSWYWEIHCKEVE